MNLNEDKPTRDLKLSPFLYMPRRVLMLEVKVAYVFSTPANLSVSFQAKSHETLVWTLGTNHHRGSICDSGLASMHTANGMAIGLVQRN